MNKKIEFLHQLKAYLLEHKEKIEKGSSNKNISDIWGLFGSDNTFFLLKKNTK